MLLCTNIDQLVPYWECGVVVQPSMKPQSRSYRGGTGNRKQFGNLRFYVSTFFRWPGQKWSTAHAWQVPPENEIGCLPLVTNGMHASSNCQACVEKGGTLVPPLYVSQSTVMKAWLWPPRPRPDTFNSYLFFPLPHGDFTPK